MTDPLAAVDVDKPDDHGLVKPFWQAAHERTGDLRHGPDGHANRHLYAVSDPLRGSASAVAIDAAAVRHPSMLAYAAKADRPREAQGNQPSPAAGPASIRATSSRWSTALPTSRSRPTSAPAPARAIARDKAEGRRLVLATASYRLYADAIAERLGFDDVIGTGSIIGLDERVPPRSRARIAMARRSSG